MSTATLKTAKEISYEKENHFFVNGCFTIIM